MPGGVAVIGGSRDGCTTIPPACGAGVPPACTTPGGVAVIGGSRDGCTTIPPSAAPRPPSPGDGWGCVPVEGKETKGSVTAVIASAAGPDSAASAAKRGRSLPAAKRAKAQDHLLSRGKPLAGVLRQHPIERGRQVRRDLRPDFADRRHGRSHVGRHLVEGRLVGRAGKGGLAGQQTVQGAAQAVDVGPQIDGVGVGDLLRRDVIGGAHRLAAGGHFFAGRLAGVEQGQPQVEDLHGAAGREHQIRGLDVPMHQAVLVRVVEPDRRLADDLAGLGDGQLAVPAGQIGQVHALDVLHHQHRLAFDLPGVHSADHVGVIDPAHGLHLTIEASHRLGVSALASGQDFQGHDPVQVDLPGLVNGPHAPFAQLLQKLVFPEPVPRQHRCGRMGVYRGRRAGSVDHRLGAANQRLALRLGQVGAGGFRPAKFCRQGIVVADRLQLGLAAGAGADVLDQLAGRGLGKLPGLIGQELGTIGAMCCRHRLGPFPQIRGALRVGWDQLA